MNPKIQDTVDDCLQRIGAGESLESCLARYPQHAEELQGILGLALAVQALPVPRASGKSIQVGRQRMLSAAKRLNEQPVSKSVLSRYAENRNARIFGKEKQDMRFLTRLVIALALAASGVLALGSTVAASANTIPGDLLYPVKTTMQDVRVLLAAEPEQRAQLWVDIQATRQADIQSVLDLKRVADVQYLGLLTSIDEQNWVVGGRTVSLPPEVQISGEPYLGAMVSVTAKTGDDGSITALSLVVDPAPDRPPFDLIRISGELIRFDHNTWVVGDHELAIVQETRIAGEPYLGARVEGTARRSGRGSLVAVALFVHPIDRHRTVRFSGVLTAIGDRSWTVGDKLVHIVPETEIIGEPHLGAVVQVTAWVADDQRLVAKQLVVTRRDHDLVRFYGLLEKITDSHWVVAGRTVQITPETEIIGEPHPGALVLVAAAPRGDSLVGVRLTVLRGDHPDHDLVRFSGSLSEFNREKWVVAGRAVAIAPETRIVGEPYIGAHVHVVASPTPQRGLVGVVLVVQPRDLPPDRWVHFAGEVTEISDGGWVIGGHFVGIGPETEIIGSPYLGARVEVFAWITPDGKLVAHKLVVIPRDVRQPERPRDGVPDTPPPDTPVPDAGPPPASDPPPADQPEPPRDQGRPGDGVDGTD